MVDPCCSLLCGTATRCADACPSILSKTGGPKQLEPARRFSVSLSPPCHKIITIQSHPFWTMGTMNRLADFTWFRTIHQLDVRSFYWLLTRRHARTLARFARIVSHSADGFYYPLAGWWLWYHDLVVGAYALALTFVLERPIRSEERRVGKECRSRWWVYRRAAEGA